MGRASDRELRDGFIRVGTLTELAAEGMMVVPGERCPLVVIHDEGRVFALDNRCPHLGFPLHRGSVKDNVLTCHWHHARFDLASGCTFDLWADDVPTATVELRNGDVWVAGHTRSADGPEHWHNRLKAGLEQNIPLLIAKSVLGLTADGVAPSAMLREAALFGLANRDGWGTGLTILTALANLVPELPQDETYLALYHAIRRVAEDCEGQAPRRDRQPLGARPAHGLPRLTRWLRHWIAVRQRDAAERTLLSAIAAGAASHELAEMMLVAVTDRVFADGGHALDFVNKAFECLDRIGWEHAPATLPTVIGAMVEARGAEELNAWRQPIDLVSLCAATCTELPGLLARRSPRPASDRARIALAEALLGDDPAAIMAALTGAVAAGALATDLSSALAYAAALRLARFGTANEVSDWEAAHHVFTYCNAIHQLLKRSTAENAQPTPELLRGIFHGAMRLYLIRFLNLPPAQLPDADAAALADLPTEAEALTAAFLASLDRRGEVDEAARIVARYLLLGHPAERLIATLAQAVLREDAGFHAYQSLEAGVQQCRAWGAEEARRRILIGLARYIAAHCPTERAALQTALVARRLSRGERLHAEIVEGDPTG